MKTAPFVVTRFSSEIANNIYDELAAQRVATLGTMGPNKRPYLSAVYYSLDDNFVFRFATKNGTQKHRNLQENPRVQLLVYDERRQLTIQVRGKAEEILDGRTRTKVVNRMYELAGKNDYNAPPASKLYAGDYVAYCIKPEFITMGLFIRPQKGGYDMYDRLDFTKSHM